MHDQMRKLLAATEKPNITVQVLPRDVGGSPGLEGPFTLLTLPCQESAELIAEAMHNYG